MYWLVVLAEESCYKFIDKISFITADLIINNITERFLLVKILIFLNFRHIIITCSYTKTKGKTTVPNQAKLENTHMSWENILY